jgi:hypothetical protein
VGDKDKGCASVQKIVPEGLITLYLDNAAGPYIDLMCDLTQNHHQGGGVGKANNNRNSYSVGGSNNNNANASMGSLGRRTPSSSTAPSDFIQFQNKNHSPSPSTSIVS